MYVREPHPGENYGPHRSFEQKLQYALERVTPRARRDEVKSGPDGGYVVSVRAPAREGKANQAVLSALARYFSVPKSALRIVRGETARHKVIQIDALPGWGTREARRSAAIHGSGQKS